MLFTPFAYVFAILSKDVVNRTSDDGGIKWTKTTKTIGPETDSYNGPPRLIFRPTTENDDDVESNLILFQRGNPNKWKHLTKSLDNFLIPYDFGKQYGHTFKQCSDQDPIRPRKVCHFDLRDLGTQCIREKNYGYDQNQPCVLIAMNKIMEWMPEPYDLDDSDSLPNDMPEDLKQVVRNPKSYHVGQGNYMVWLSCQGENPADRENMGELEYFPQPGFPTYFFPFLDTPGYLEPVVMIRFKNLQPGVLVNIECKAWAKNIKHSDGRVHFEILMD